MQTIPVAQENAFFQQRVELDGVPFILDFTWVTRSDAWALAILTDSGTRLVSGLRIVANRLLLSRFKYIVGMPAGDLMFPSRGEDVPAPDFTGLSELIYFTADELE